MFSGKLIKKIPQCKTNPYFNWDKVSSTLLALFFCSHYTLASCKTSKFCLTPAWVKIAIVCITLEWQYLQEHYYYIMVQHSQVGKTLLPRFDVLAYKSNQEVVDYKSK